MDQKQLERLLGIGPALAEGLELETVLRRIVDAAREVTGARYAALGVLDATGEALERFITAGLSEEEIARIGDLPHGRGVLGVPIRVRGEAYGNLYLTEKSDGEFDEADQETVCRLADWAGIAIENARLYGTAREQQIELQRTVEVLETNVEIARAIGAT